MIADKKSLPDIMRPRDIHKHTGWGMGKCYRLSKKIPHIQESENGSIYFSKESYLQWLDDYLKGRAS